MRLLFDQPGEFGRIRVADEGGQRTLYIDKQPQGSVYLEDDGQPGGVAACEYSLGWMPAFASRDPEDQEALMVGLGSGCGALSVCENFPHAMFTVLEIDPQVIKAVEQCYPRTWRLVEDGRIEIVETDAQAWLEDAPDQYPIGLHDAFTGSHAVETQMLNDLGFCCDSVYVNCIDRYAGDSMRKCIRQLLDSGHEVSEIWRADNQPFRPFTSLSNWIIAADPGLSLGCCDRLELYPGREDRLAELARTTYERLLSSGASSLVDK